MKVLVTGASGSVGRALCPKLRELGHEVVETDISFSRMNRYRLDVTDIWQVREAVELHGPHVIVHLAGFKQAPDAEVDPLEVTRVNVTGTANVVSTGVRTILSSTCKAADPETAYGASKLIAERIVLNAGGTVVRFYNVRETDGNVFRLWESLPETDPIPYTDCVRYFISMDDAVELMVEALGLRSGRYSVFPGRETSMQREAAKLYPGRELVEVPRRRGDRYKEPLRARSEKGVGISHRIFRIESPHDPPQPKPINGFV